MRVVATDCSLDYILHLFWLFLKYLLIKCWKRQPLTRFQRVLQSTFSIVYSFQGQPQGLGFQVCIYPGDSCDPVLRWERIARKEDGVWKITQHSPLHVRDALYPDREETGWGGGAVQATHHTDRYYVQMSAPMPAQRTLGKGSRSLESHRRPSVSFPTPGSSQHLFKAYLATSYFLLHRPDFISCARSLTLFRICFKILGELYTQPPSLLMGRTCLVYIYYYVPAGTCSVNMLAQGAGSLPPCLWPWLVTPSSNNSSSRKLTACRSGLFCWNCFMYFLFWKANSQWEKRWERKKCSIC